MTPAHFARRWRSLLALALCVPAAARADDAAEFRVAGVFGDRAVLQRGVDVPLWGRAKPGASVRAEFAGQSRSAEADASGNWALKLPPLEASAAGRQLTVRCGEVERSFEDVLVGEVWLASGQSNMQFSMGACARSLARVRAAMEDPAPLEIRMLRVDIADAPKPVADLDRSKSRWVSDSPAARPGQSAVAFFFARRLHQELGVPIGIIETSWGGKPIEGFIPRGEFERHESLRPILKLADENRLEELKRLEGGVFVRNTAGLPGRIYNSRIAPLAPFALRGFIWYQGESNAGTDEDPRNYRHKMRALIEGWRDAWKQPAAPFYFVQLPSFRNESSGWIRLREEQRLSLSVPHTGMAVAIDLRDADIHPANKIDVGERLANWPLARDYGLDRAFSGPLFESAEISGSTARVKFSHADGGLMAARKAGLDPPVETPGAALDEFELADASGAWRPATATIEGGGVLVRSDAVAHPVAVRYACSGAPANANLYNRAGLPASPLCSRLEFLPWPHPEAAK